MLTISWGMPSVPRGNRYVKNFTGYDKNIMGFDPVGYAKNIRGFVWCIWKT